MPAPAPPYYTADMVRALPDDGNRYEVVYGELLVTPAPRLTHQRVLLRLVAALTRYLEREPVGELLISPADISWGQDTLVQPDLFIVPVAETKMGEWHDVQQLDLVVEILSPTTARQDRFHKRRLYQAVGVPLYWIVDVESQEVEVWKPEDRFPRIERERITWDPAGAREEFSLPLEELFRPI